MNPRRRRAVGGRMQNYYPTPVRYTLSAGDAEDTEFAPRLAGFAFIVNGILLLTRPFLSMLDVSAGLMFPGLGGPFVVLDDPSRALIVAIGVVSVLIGVGIVGGYQRMRQIGAMVSVLMFAGSWPVGAVVSAAMIYALWPSSKGVKRPASDASSAVHTKPAT